MERQFGFELEFSDDGSLLIDDNSESPDWISEGSLEDLLSDSTAQIRRAYPEHPLAQIGYEETSKSWTIKEDGSCGYEITSPALPSSEDSFEKVDLILSHLEKRLCRDAIDDRCGLHIHIEVSDFSHEQIVNLYRMIWLFEPHIFLLFPDREGNHYLVPVRENVNFENLNVKDLDRSGFFSSNHGDDDTCLCGHYSATNFRSWLKNKRIEFRYAPGTKSAEDVISWIVLLLCLVEISKTKIVKRKVRYKESIRSLWSFIKRNKTEHRHLEKMKPRVLKWMSKKIPV